MFPEAHSILELYSRKTVHISEQIMTADKYPCICSRYIKAIVYLVHQSGAFLNGMFYNFESFKKNNFSKIFAQKKNCTISIRIDT